MVESDQFCWIKARSRWWDVWRWYGSDNWWEAFTWKRVGWFHEQAGWQLDEDLARWKDWYEETYEVVQFGDGNMD